MTKDKSRIGILISAFLTLVFLGLAPVTVAAADTASPTDGTSGGDTSQGVVSSPYEPTDNKSTSVNPGDTMQPASGKPPTVATSQDSQQKLLTLQQQGNSYLAKLREKEGNHTQSVADRQKKCQQLQSMVNQKVSDFSRNAQSHLATFNSVYSKVQAFAASKNVSSSEYTALVAAANSQQASAEQAVNALKSVAVTINCSATDPASSLSTVKSAVDSTRNALQAYQKAIAAVISNLEANVKQ